MSRPTKLSPEVAGRILDALRVGCTHEAACAAGPVSPSTFYEWLRRGRAQPRSAFAEFARDVDQAELEAERALVKAWHEQARTDWRGAQALLERRFPERWRRDPERVELSGGVRMELTRDERARRLADNMRDFLTSDEEPDPTPLPRDVLRDDRDHIERPRGI